MQNSTTKQSDQISGMKRFFLWCRLNGFMHVNIFICDEKVTCTYVFCTHWMCVYWWIHELHSHTLPNWYAYVWWCIVKSILHKLPWDFLFKPIHFCDGLCHMSIRWDYTSANTREINEEQKKWQRRYGATSPKYTNTEMAPMVDCSAERCAQAVHVLFRWENLKGKSLLDATAMHC